MVKDTKNQRSAVIPSERIALSGNMSRSDWELTYAKVRALARSHGLDANLVELKPALQAGIDDFEQNN